MRKPLKPLDFAALNANDFRYAVSSPLQQLLDDFRRQDRVHAGSLIISVFGDAVVPRGGRVWLGSLIRLLQPLGLNERLVRTAVFRLVRDEWLASERSGRRTDYLLTPSGEQRIDEASRLIYAAATPHWDRRWRLIVTVGELAAKDRERLRKALVWHGFGSLNNDCFVHPSVDLIAAFDALVAEGLGGLLDRLKPLMAADATLGTAASDAAMVHSAWDLEHLADMYRAFVARYQPVLGSLRDGGFELADETAFLLRVLLIHDYRRLLLRDPALPDVLLPPDWPGQKARLLCRELYRRLLAASERHLDACFQLADGSVPEASARLHERFRDTDLLGLPG
ncbi:phenylacetic acid degradation operon negative regulatory protein PaaX [Thauera linaloolentis]|uniref:PaaX family transcriptional regulator n=1 Tax=Thauera linaloolentis (strain DSM 12138 / JCM 21573 / CCUG 41526 / CIP 105981 / IAM 15112 / NBRC 102519 / 47Lol) TaxID=1123367 RepID=N6Z424_THAL4|nr:phenylacetic acid degradation operon negative regulatory protein PaaX [Thauera linaloolentis]ENO89332.1 PaaX family transcriptional regulator [Thauera linaloolentis 47Lol = DSM 12138]MCM8565019.1 phenylacetic acid degradation operon negative regulatory protein PaaX [Thauera linaloolentis]